MPDLTEAGILLNAANVRDPAKFEGATTATVAKGICALVVFDDPS
jgi:hypothetical protein